MNTQFLALIGEATSEPLWGTIVDIEEDDPVDVKDTVDDSRYRKRHGYYGGGRYSMVDEEFEAKQVELRRRFDEYIAEGYTSEEARQRVIGIKED